jgi:hypothetical protein
MPMRDTRNYILMKLNWHYLFSGAIDRALYTRQYIDYMTIWCAKWYIPLTTDEKATIQTLLQQRNWTREYWH